MAAGGRGGLACRARSRFRDSRARWRALRWLTLPPPPCRRAARPLPPPPLQQIQTRWPHSGEAGAFKKLEYAAGPYDDTSKRDKTKKAGFGTTSSLNRDDLSSTIEVGRYRHHLEAEAKQSRAGTEAIMAEARALSASSRPRDAPTVGIAASLPRFASEFDRSNFVAEFTTKDDPRKKGERVFGTLRPTSAGYGEGAWRKDLLAAPEHAVGNFAASMSSKYARPSSSLSALVPRQV